MGEAPIPVNFQPEEPYVIAWREANRDLPDFLSRSSGGRAERFVGEDFSGTLLNWAYRRSARMFEFERCCFRDAVDLRALCEEREVLFRDCVFEDKVDGDAGKFARPVKFVRCRLKRSVGLQEAAFRHGLSITQCLVEMADRDAPPGLNEPELNEAPGRPRSAWWPGLRVTGMLRLDRTFFGGGVNLAEGRIVGPLYARGIEVGCQPRGIKSEGGDPPPASQDYSRGTRKGRLHLMGLRVRGDLVLSPHTQRRELANTLPSKVRGSVVLSGCEVKGRVDLRGIDIDERLQMVHAEVRDRLELDVWRHDTDQKECSPWIFRTRIGHKHGVAVRLTDADIGHTASFCGAELVGQVHAMNLKVGGDLSLRQRREERKGCKEIARCEPFEIRLRASSGGVAADLPAYIDEAVKLSGARIKGSLDFDGAIIQGKLNLLGITTGGSLLATALAAHGIPDSRGRSRGIDFSNAAIGASVDFRGATVDLPICGRECEVGKDLHFGSDPGRDGFVGSYSGIDVSNATVGGLLTIGRANYRGRIEAAGIKVGHHCELAGGTHDGPVCLDHAGIDGKLDIGKPRPPDGTEQMTRFNRGLSLVRSLVRADLTFYWVELHPETPCAPALNLELACVNGSWRDHPEASHREGEFSAVIHGKVEAASLRVDGNVDFGSMCMKRAVRLTNARGGGDLKVTGCQLQVGLDASGSRWEGRGVFASAAINRPGLSGGGRGLLKLEQARFRTLELSIHSGRGGCGRIDLSHTVADLLKMNGQWAYGAKPIVRSSGARFSRFDVEHLATDGEVERVDKLQRWKRALYLAGLPASGWAAFYVISIVGLGPLVGRWAHQEWDHTSPIWVFSAVAGALVFAFHIATRQAETLSGSRGEQLLVRQLCPMDNGMFEQVEGWLRNEGRHNEADDIYLERRALELEAGSLSWLYRCMRAWQTRGVERAKHLLLAGRAGRQAFRHPREVPSPRNPVAVQLPHLIEGAKREGLIRLFRFPGRCYSLGMFLLVGDGVRTGPAVVVWLAFFMVSWTQVFVQPESVERPATFLAPRDLSHTAGLAPRPAREEAWARYPSWHESMGDAAHEHWKVSDAFWVALDAHVPLFEFSGREKWRPSSNYLRIDVVHIRYDTWAAMCKVTGWVLVPIILGSLVGLLRRKPARVEAE